MTQTFGRYIPGRSIVHRIHPALKFLLFIMTIVMIFVPSGFAGYIILSVWVLGIYALSGIGWRTMFTTARSMLVLAALLFLINWLTMNASVSSFNYSCFGGTPLDTSNNVALAGSFPPNPPVVVTSNNMNCAAPIQYDGFINHKYGGENWYAVTDQAIWTTLYVTIKIFFMIIIASVLTATTSSLELTSAIEDLLRPLKIFRLPVSEAAMMISIALRFVPSLVLESQRILNAQASRGIDASNGSPLDKMKSIISLVVPLFSIAFQKADDLANAMEARSYNPRYARTRYRLFKVKPWDYLVLFLLVVYMTFMISWAAIGFLFVPFGNPEAVVVLSAAG